jgi:hypothetical protein
MSDLCPYYGNQFCNAIELKAKLEKAEKEVELLRKVVAERIERVYTDTPCQFCAKGVVLCLLDGGKCYMKEAKPNE